MSFRVLLLMGLFAWPVLASSSTSPRPIVLELFTSQGCSSCPPADALLGELAKRPDVLALAFHVDYWDGDGWTDPFGLPVAAQRQRQYVKQLGLRTAATPQLIVDGRVEVLGGDRSRVKKALEGSRLGAVIHLAQEQAELLVTLEPADHSLASEVLLIAYRPEATTVVSGGENKGRALQNFNIVRFYRPLGRWDGVSASWRIALNTFPSDASRVALLVQERQSKSIVAAASASIDR